MTQENSIKGRRERLLTCLALALTLPTQERDRQLASLPASFLGHKLLFFPWAAELKPSGRNCQSIPAEESGFHEDIHTPSFSDFSGAL